MEKWIYVGIFAFVGVLLGLLIDKIILKDQKIKCSSSIILAIGLGLVSFCFSKLVQIIIYSLMTCILLVLAYKVKGFDYEADEEKRKNTSLTMVEVIFIVSLFCLGCLAAWLFNDIEMLWWHRAIGLVAASVPFMIMGRKKESLRDGEVFIMAAGGVMLGWKNILLAVFLGIFFSSAVSCFKLLTRSREEKGKKLKPMRMVPFLSLGIFVAALYGNDFLNWFYQLYMK